MSYPLCRTGTLAGSPAVEMTAIFLWMPALIEVVPWKYAVRTFVMPARASLPESHFGVRDEADTLRTGN